MTLLAPRLLSLPLGLLMVAATQVQTSGSALIAAALAAAAVIAGIVFRPAATLAVLITVVAIVLTDPAPALAVLSGLSAAGYLVLRYAADAVTQPTVIGALGFSSVGLLATALPLHVPWLPLVAPLTVLAIFVIVTQPFLGDRGRPSR
jgi:hypothetical protein